MATTQSNIRLAVLIDADNAQPSVIEGLLAEVAKLGVASVKRIYGDWTSTGTTQWKQSLLRYSITPVQQFAYTKGKNATDASLIIDAMDLMHTHRFGGFLPGLERQRLHCTRTKVARRRAGRIRLRRDRRRRRRSEPRVTNSSSRRCYDRLRATRQSPSPRALPHRRARWSLMR